MFWLMHLFSVKRVPPFNQSTLLRVDSPSPFCLVVSHFAFLLQILFCHNGVLTPTFHISILKGRLLDGAHGRPLK